MLGNYRNNHLGLRIEKEAKDPLNPQGPPVRLRTLWDGQEAILDQNDASQVVARYDFAGRAPIGLWHKQDGTQALHSDALGSVVLTTDTAGAAQTETLFDAWGNPIVEAGQSANKFGYTGHQMDDESGLIYAQARYYDPETGRFLTQDPAEGNPETPLTYNSYLYAYGNPTVWIDPDGETNQQALGLDDASVDESMRNDPMWWGATKYAFNSTLYEVWNFTSGGFVKRHDARLDLRDAGQITQEQFERSTLLDATVSVAANYAGGAVGGKVAGAVGSRVGANSLGKVTTQVATGGAVGGVTNAIEQAGQLAEHYGISDKLGQAEFSGKDLLKAVVTSAAVAPVFGKAAEAIDARLQSSKLGQMVDSAISRVMPKRTGAVVSEESAGGPGAAASKAAVPEQKSVPATRVDQPMYGSAGASSLTRRQYVEANLAESRAISENAGAGFSQFVQKERGLATSSAEVVPRLGPKGVDSLHHNANVMVRDSSSKVVSHERFVSGSMTPEEQALGFPRNTLASHTEARAVRNTELQAGDNMTITGQNPPCPSCKGAMNRTATETGATIKYQWRQDGKTLTWTAKPKK